MYNNTSSQRNSYEDLLDVEESAHKAKLITYNRVSRRRKKMHAEVVESVNSNVSEGIKCRKNCTALIVNKNDTLVCNDSSETGNTPTKFIEKPLLKHNVQKCVDILDKAVVDRPLEKAC